MNATSTFVLATLLPESILGTRWFAVLSTFVAINTIVYVSMSIFKILPKPYFSDFVGRHGRRAETRSIYPDEHGEHNEGPRRGTPSIPAETLTNADRDLTGSPAPACLIDTWSSQLRPAGTLTQE